MTQVAVDRLAVEHAHRHARLVDARADQRAGLREREGGMQHVRAARQGDELLARAVRSAGL